MRLFDEIERNDSTLAQHAEPEFTHLNRSVRMTASRIRQVLEAWFYRYPEIEQEEFATRFRSPIDSQHRAAFFELFIHELLLRLGCHVEIHPKPPDGTKRPDYLALSPGGNRFYMEATLATGESVEETGAQARMNAVYDGLNRLLDSPNFFIGMELRGAPETQPSTKKMATFLQEHLALLDPDEITHRAESGDLESLPRWHYEHEGWIIDFFPIPKKANARGKSGVRPIGLWLNGFRCMDSRTAVRDAIVEKARRYGNLDLPYIVAVNVFDHIDQIGIMEALFGKEQYTVTWTGSQVVDPIQPEMTRIPDGAWTSRAGPRYTRVSAVLLTTHLSPWNLPHAGICLYHNPWAQKPYSAELTHLPQAIPQSGRMKWLDGESLATIFSLPLGWPEE